MKPAVMITGATRGIGRSLVYAFAQRGFDIAFCSGREEDCFLLSEELKKRYPDNRYFARACNVADGAQIKTFVTSAQDALGSLKILINNAGVGVFDSFTNIRAEDWQRIFAVNFMGPVMLCEELIPLFLQNEGYPKGIIVNIGSYSVEKYVPGNIAYAASKGSLKTFSEDLFCEYRKDGICVTYVSLGSVNTGFSRRFSANADLKMTPSDVAEAVASVAELMLGSKNLCISQLELRTTTPPEAPGVKE
ncbi:MAG: SDR family oxidoreductase [Clostridia bacterium]|nr:SDR family oxidoreductase [Clostridia bacterium]